MIQCPRGAAEILGRAVEWIRGAQRPMIVAGGGVIYGEATDALSRFAAQTGSPVAETQAGKGALCYNHGQALGAMGVTGTPGANVIAREADLVIGIGTRYSDFTTASKTAFQNPEVRFVNINVAEFDSFKHGALPVVADAKVTLKELAGALQGYRVSEEYRERIDRFRLEWEEEVDRIHNVRHGPPLSQGEVIGVVNKASRPQDVVVCAASSLPGDLHKLWHPPRPQGLPPRVRLLNDGLRDCGRTGNQNGRPGARNLRDDRRWSYLMMAQEIATSIQEGYKLNIIVLDNHGFSSIGGLVNPKGETVS